MIVFAQTDLATEVGENSAAIAAVTSAIASLVKWLVWLTVAIVALALLKIWGELRTNRTLRRVELFLDLTARHGQLTDKHTAEMVGAAAAVKNQAELAASIVEKIPEQVVAAITKHTSDSKDEGNGLPTIRQ